MPKIQRSTRPGKTWMVKVKNPKTGKTNTIHGGQKGVKTGKARDAKTRKSFRARHGEPKTPKQYVNDKLWKNKKVGDSISIPKRLF